MQLLAFSRGEKQLWESSAGTLLLRSGSQSAASTELQGDAMGLNCLSSVLTAPKGLLAVCSTMSLLQPGTSHAGQLEPGSGLQPPKIYAVTQEKEASAASAL